eukprot:TRINITY_DN27622_c0_g1_i4.p1 TRINITY_DN27622_c0_g1~~TRINITY_DN27622_c0_g1_i4.p1  ORF type:complete len:194 (-),score=36.61 TRINITY_DN27622_c0_g1_i4:803-1384(-)
MQQLVDYKWEIMTGRPKKPPEKPTAPSPMKGLRRVSFVVDDLLKSSAPDGVQRRGSLQTLSDGEKRRELLSRLRDLDLEQQRLRVEGRQTVLDDVLRLHEEEYTYYTNEKVETFSLMLDEMIDVYRVAWAEREDLVQEHRIACAQVDDLRNESAHWRSEADRLWCQVKERQDELVERGLWRAKPVQGGKPVTT